MLWLRSSPTTKRVIESPHQIAEESYQPKRFHTAWVKSGKARSEHILSGLPPKADIVDAFWHFRFVPKAAQAGGTLDGRSGRMKYDIKALAGSRRNEIARE